MAKKLPYRLLDSKKIYEGRIFRVVKDRFILRVAPKKVVSRLLVVHPGAVVVLPFVDAKRILLIRQFRYAAKGDLWEIPAGTLEKNEATLKCAKRELEEETGFKARRWSLLTRFYSAPGISDEIMTLYKAQELFPGRKNLDHDEWIEHEAVPINRALRMVRDGRIKDAKSIIGILWSATFKARR